MTRLFALERQILEALRGAKAPSTSELLHILEEKGINANRPGVKNALRALEDEGEIKNVGGEAPAWSRK